MTSIAVDLDAGSKAPIPPALSILCIPCYTVTRIHRDFTAPCMHPCHDLCQLQQPQHLYDAKTDQPCDTLTAPEARLTCCIISAPCMHCSRRGCVKDIVGCCSLERAPAAVDAALHCIIQMAAAPALQVTLPNPSCPPLCCPPNPAFPPHCPPWRCVTPPLLIPPPPAKPAAFHTACTPHV